ncbi:alpha/beta hydrolase [Sphingobium phenoxybenzoativorans]|uniref:Alpha/beta hydrolase n=1 Tax=Sphingobium phenoxybenzoativorans TaxID=1592790 RepID=A0A975Q2D1_9SPHN|nr:alpha/beta hydrolase [Sphingobium phenoxybenzoativorans]QUT06880.1 alpha/beta hydrolase [Sphingobium phenoxybenzoativorans]
MTDCGPTQHRFVSQRLSLNYLDWGNPTAPLLLLIHGGQDHARSWDWVARSLRDEWHVVCPDLRGHGDSSWSRDGSYSLPLFVADLAQLVDHLDESPVSIVAHSLGGGIALRYAGLYPELVRKLAVIEGLEILPIDHKPDLPIIESWRTWIEQRRALSARSPHRYATLENACTRMREANPHLTIDHAQHLTIHGLKRNEDGSCNWKFDNYIRALIPIDLSENPEELWRNIQCPVWLVHGADSWAIHPERDGKADHFKHVLVTSCEAAGHWVHHDRFDSFLHDLQAFL